MISNHIVLFFIIISSCQTCQMAGRDEFHGREPSNPFPAAAADRAFGWGAWGTEMIVLFGDIVGSCATCYDRTLAELPAELYAGQRYVYQSLNKVVECCRMS